MWIGTGLEEGRLPVSGAGLSCLSRHRTPDGCVDDGMCAALGDRDEPGPRVGGLLAADDSGTTELRLVDRRVGDIEGGAVDGGQSPAGQPSITNCHGPEASRRSGARPRPDPHPGGHPPGRSLKVTDLDIPRPTPRPTTVRRRDQRIRPHTNRRC